MSAHAMNIIHRLVISISILCAAAVWFLVRADPEVSNTQTVLYMVLPGASVAAGFYCVCMVFNCLGRR